MRRCEHCRCSKKEYDAIPWFWSDQYKFKLQITGIAKGYTSFVERSSSDSMSVFYFKGENCIAADTINRPRDPDGVASCDTDEGHSELSLKR